MGAFRIVAVIGVVVLAAILANMALLSRAASKRDPVGRLSPVVATVTPSTGPAQAPASSSGTPSQQSNHESEREGDEDD
jgi:hypothetical protein